MVKKLASIITRYYTFWIIVFAAFAYYYSDFFLPFSGHVKLLLSFTMLCMGLTLEVRDFKRIAEKPIPILVGVLCQFLIMPFLGFILAYVMDFEPMIATGLVLLGSCPGGVASNVLVYLAKGNLALSIFMTSISTLLAPIMIPVLLLIYAHQWVKVDPFSLFISTLQIVLIPVLLGILINKFIPNASNKAKPFTPALSSIAILVIVTSMIAINHDNLDCKGELIFIAVVIHNFFGLCLGYLIPKFLNYPLSYRKTISIEVGVQNGGLGAALALLHFSPITAVPSVFFAIWALITGSMLSTIWHRQSS